MTFSTRTDLLPHQVPAVAKLLPLKVGAMFMDMGTGKSRVLLELARLRWGRFDRLIWLCPVALKETMRQQILEHTTIPGDEILVWGDRTARSESKAWVHIIGIESLSTSDRVVLAYNGVVSADSFVAVDESSYIKGPRANRTQRIVNMSARAKYRMLMTGTPYTQGAVDLYSQMRFLSPKILGYSSFFSFAANHLVYEERRQGNGAKRKTGRIVRTLNEAYLAARIAPYVYQVKKEECLDLPEKLHSTRWCTMTEEQKELYERAKNAVLDEDPFLWSYLTIFKLFTALQSVVCGFWGHGGEVETCQHKRIALLRAVVREIPEGEKVIIWGKFHRSIQEIKAELEATYGPGCCAEFHGRLSGARRYEELARWRSDPQARFLLATQSCGGHGLTLNEAAFSIFYADGFKYAERLQAEDRNHRLGQARRPTYITLRCDASIDDRIAAAIERKGNSLRIFQERVAEEQAAGSRESLLGLVRSL